jgi:hypothetical protein
MSPSIAPRPILRKLLLAPLLILALSVVLVDAAAAPTGKPGPAPRAVDVSSPSGHLPYGVGDARRMR